MVELAETAMNQREQACETRPLPVVELAETAMDRPEPVSTTRGLPECVFAQKSKHI
ncbi:hypothetical protein [Cryobacterium sp. Hh11]|uniref:hypothetical protein n=1 Tax=Cryobacterium sp. Hh11 TaxID=2555868 RepID=UPI00141BCBFB|nr:hypothetical protein [Cryobacterium sp. Hh11]